MDKEPQYDLQTISLEEIGESTFALRSVDRDSIQFKELVESIRNKGFSLSAVTLRERSTNEPDGSLYIIIDGLQRVNAARDVGLTSVPAQIVKGLDDLEILESQMMANANKVDTKNHQYAQAIAKMFALQQTLTLTEVAGRLGKSPTWVAQMLKLNKIQNTEIRALIDEGKIGLANAWTLVRLPEVEMPNFVAQAQTEAASDFTATVAARTKELKDAARQGRQPKERKFAPTAHMRKTGEIKAELVSPANGQNILEELGITDPVDVWIACIEWVMHLDSGSVQMQRAKYEEREALQKAAAVTKKAEKERAKAKVAAENAAKAEAAAEEAQKSLV